MKIRKHKNEEGRQIVSIDLEIPVTISSIGERSFEECAEMAQTELNLKTGTIFNHLDYLTPLAENNDVEMAHYFDVVALLTMFGKGLTETAANVEMARKRNIKPKQNSNEKPLDLSQLQIGGVQ
jgi:hypothetical protein